MFVCLFGRLDDGETENGRGVFIRQRSMLPGAVNNRMRGGLRVDLIVRRGIQCDNALTVAGGCIVALLKPGVPNLVLVAVIVIGTLGLR